MPAPPADIVSAFRRGTAAAHWFFEMDHSTGPVRVWDGIGDFVFSGLTFRGIGGLASIQGLGASAEIQNHEVLLTLNAVPFEALLGLDTNIRDRAATIWRVVIDEQLSVIGSRVIFRGKGDSMRSKPGVDSLALLVKLRAPLADWSVTTARYYTLRDQQRMYPDDTGFSEVAGLENGSVTGWSKDAETSGGVPVFYSVFGSGDVVRSNVTGTPIGSASLGLSTYLFGSGSPLTLAANSGLTNAYKENGSGASATCTGSGANVQVGGVNSYIDVANDVRSAGGQLLYPAGYTSAAKLRLQTAITANGAAGSVSVEKFSAQSNRIAKAGSGYTYGAADQSALIYANESGLPAMHTTVLNVAGVTYVEETTGTAVTLSGSSTLQVGGVDLKLSANGVLLSSGGRRIVASGGAASSFLRMWT